MDDQIKQKFIDNLKQNGFSATKTRLIVFGLLVNQEPQGMNDLIKKSRNKVDRVTLYRTIELFEKLNIAEKVYTGWKYKIELSDEYTFHHHHLTCLSCNKLIPITEDPEAEKVILNLAKSKSFKAIGHQLEIRGYCKDCAAHLMYK